ncbi:type II toxin-antitoxin system VapB family antitoxin [Taklimakanibacter deserti]|uniref:type II toxin-antitoxin system VapB family antitoxin n=1 Tax=Taklimakanibacter deserti TaxID=2267839 RepID=UPI000E64E052
MRTTIEINDKLMKRAMKMAGTSTKRETVERALQVLIYLEVGKSIRKLRGKFNWEGDLGAMRRD